MKIAFYILIVISLVTGSCSNQEPKLDSKNLIPENELISLLIDIHITDGLLEIPGINTAYSVLDSISTYYHVIEKHGYTKEAMDKTMKYYFIKNPKKLNRIYDMALGKLSEMESRIEKESNIEQARLSNLWRGKDFYAVPSVSNIDSTELNITISNHGYYKLTFTTTVYPDDQAVNPRLTIYSVSADSLEIGRRSYLKTWGYIKDGAPHTYNLTLNVPVNTNIHFGGSLFDSENRKEGIQNHYKIENISLSYSIVDL